MDWGHPASMQAEESLLPSLLLPVEQGGGRLFRGRGVRGPGRRRSRHGSGRWHRWHDENIASAGCCAGCRCARFNDAENGNRHGFLNSVKREGACGIAGNDEIFRTLLFDEESGAFRGVACDGAAGFGAVGKTGRVAKETELGLGKKLSNARRTVRPPNPESKTPMEGDCVDVFLMAWRLRGEPRRRQCRCG